MRTRLLVSAYTGLVLYLVTMFFFGTTGHFSYQTLKKQSDILQKNVKSLTDAGRKLGYSVTALRSDSESIVKAGRRLLLLRKSEGIIRVAGYREKPKPLSPGGLVVVKKEAGLYLEPFLRAFAFSGGLLMFLLYRPGTRNKRRGGPLDAPAYREHKCSRPY